MVKITRIKHLLLVAVVLVAALSHAQQPYNAAAPNGYTKKAAVSEQVGLTNIVITYHRPAVNGREGKIWGQLIHKGFADQGFGNRLPAPWRAGANENTVIEFDQDATVNGQNLPKGRYGLFLAYDPEECTIIFSKRTDAWGSFFYNEKEDALRVKAKPVAIEKSVEFLKYEFINQTQNSAVITLSWEKLSIPFKVEVDYLKQQFDAFVAESQNPRGFTAQGLNVAATWALQNNYELEKALAWANTATSANFPGDPTSFPALATKALILGKLERVSEAEAVIKTALPFGSVGQVQQLGRQFLAAKKTKLALDIFNFNYTKHPNDFVTKMGMVRGLSANSEFAKALEFAKSALPLAPNDANKQAVLAMIEKLSAGKDVN